MNITPKFNIGTVNRGVLIIAVLGLIGWVSHLALAPPPITATGDGVAAREFSQSGAVVPAVELIPAPGLQTAGPDYYQPAAWYGSKHWWKRNAPVVGGAAGGALIGGLAGGGKGVLIGGAVGGGGGYLYKRLHHRHYHHPVNTYNQHPANTKSTVARTNPRRQD
jgi:hypothetical protein